MSLDASDEQNHILFDSIAVWFEALSINHDLKRIADLIQTYVKKSLHNITTSGIEETFFYTLNCWLINTTIRN